METIVSNQEKQVHISPNSKITIIGEKINPTGRKKLSAAIKAGDYEYIQELARQQVKAGADILDVNVGVPGINEDEVLPQVVKLLAKTTNVPLCLDSASPQALAAALPFVSGKPIINSVNGEESSLETVLPLVKEHEAAVIGLTMDDQGIPDSPKGRVSIAEKILERSAQIGIPAEDVIIDPLTLTVGAGHTEGKITLQTSETLVNEFGVNVNLGASNVSFGLPRRDVLNTVFLALAAAYGVSCVITDPIKYSLDIRAIDFLLGRDTYGASYIKHYRERSQRKS